MARTQPPLICFVLADLLVQEWLERHNSTLARDMTIALRLDASSRGKEPGFNGAGSRRGETDAMGAIGAACSISELAAVLETRWDTLEMVPATAAMVRFAKLLSSAGNGGGKGQGTSASKRPAGERARSAENESKSSADTLLLRLLPAVQRVAWVMDARGVCNTLWALSKLPPSASPLAPGLLEDLIGAAALRSPDMTAQNVSNALYALALLEQRRWGRAESCRLVPAARLAPLLDASGTKLYMFGPQALANSAWAIARLGGRPTAAWTASFLERCSAAAGRMLPREIAMLTWALVKLGVRPGPELMEQLLTASHGSLHRSANHPPICCSRLIYEPSPV